MTYGPLIIQSRICQILQLPLPGPLRRTSGASVFRMVVIPLLFLVQAVLPQVTFASADPHATDPQNDQALGADAEDVELLEEHARESETIDLLTTDLSEHWKVFSSGPEIPETPVWKVISEENNKELVLICSGTPKGFLYTKQTCDEFELSLEWKYPEDADGNSGVLVYTQDEPRIWPTSMQIQLHQPKAGSVFPSGDATSDQSSEAEEKSLARPVDIWNEGRIISQGGRLSVEVNGRKAGVVTGAKPSVGSIALQSEGSVVHFRRIRLKKRLSAKSVKQAGVLTPARMFRR